MKCESLLFKDIPNYGLAIGQCISKNNNLKSTTIEGLNKVISQNVKPDQDNPIKENGNYVNLVKKTNYLVVRNSKNDTKIARITFRNPQNNLGYKLRKTYQ